MLSSVGLTWINKVAAFVVVFVHLLKKCDSTSIEIFFVKIPVGILSADVPANFFFSLVY